MNLIRHGQSHFNVVFNETRVDPGIVDPGLTDEGERQATAAAEMLTGRDVRSILASPYSRTLHTAEIIAGRLGLEVTVEPLVRERSFFVCDVGSPRSRLTGRWPGFEFGDLPERWWPDGEETEQALHARCTAFRASMAETNGWRHIAVVSHWGFIRGLTGREVANGTILSFDPTAD